jgi:CBS domain-containing protein
MQMQQTTVPQEQLDLIERFITAFNSIEGCLREFFNADKSVTISKLLRDYSTRYPRWKDGDQLLRLAEIRNFLVHDRKEMYQYLSIPTVDAVNSIEKIRDSLLAPELVLPRFQRDVITVQYEEPLVNVLKMIEENSFSQFPVYQNQEFVGLLTENGITRWLANHVSRVLTLVDFSDEKAGSVLAEEEKRRNCEFIPRDCTVLEAESKFAANGLLEALFISQNGKSRQSMIGIITRWDVFTQ